MQAGLARKGRGGGRWTLHRQGAFCRGDEVGAWMHGWERKRTAMAEYQAAGVLFHLQVAPAKGVGGCGRGRVPACVGGDKEPP